MLLLSSLLALAAAPGLLLPPWPSSAPRSQTYSARARVPGGTWDSATVLWSAPNLKQGPDGSGVTTVLDDRSLSYMPLDRTGSIEIEVRKNFGTTASRVEIQPKSYGIEPRSFDGRTVRFVLPDSLPGPAYVSVLFHSADNQDDDGNGGKNVRNGMMVFADPPDAQAPKQGDPGVVVYSRTASLATANTILFPAGEWRLKDRFPDGVLRLAKNGQRVHLQPGAFVQGAVHGEGFDKVAITGRGVFSGAEFVFHEIRDENGVKDAFMNFIGSDDGSFEGVVIENPTHHTWPSSNRSRYEKVKVVGWASNHDGIRPASGSSARDLFLKTCDDLDYARDPHTMVRAVVWPCRNGSFGQLGWNNLGSGKAVYRDLFFINSEWIGEPTKRNVGVLGSVLQQGVDLRNDTLENLQLEDFTGILAHITIQREAGEPWNAAKPGRVGDFLLRNIILEHPFLTPNGKVFRNPLKGFTFEGATAKIENFKFVNLVAGNEVVTSANASKFFDIDPATTSGITFTTDAPIHWIRVSAGPGGRIVPSRNASDSVPVPRGMDRSVSIVPDAGKRILDVKVDGVSQGRRQLVLFRDVAANHRVEATFGTGEDVFQAVPPTTTAPRMAISRDLRLLPADRHSWILQVTTDQPGAVQAILTDLNGRQLQVVSTEAGLETPATLRIDRSSTTAVLRVIGPGFEERRLVPGR